MIINNNLFEQREPNWDFDEVCMYCIVFHYSGDHFVQAQIGHIWNLSVCFLKSHEQLGSSAGNGQ